MLKVKGNYKNKYTELTCRWCKNNVETQEHILKQCAEFTHITKNTTYETYFCKDHALSCGRPRKIMKGGGLRWGVMDVGTSRYGRHDVGTPELRFKYILQGVSVPNQHLGRLCKHTQKN